MYLFAELHAEMVKKDIEMAAQSTLVLILQSSPSLREIQPENRTVSMPSILCSNARAPVRTVLSMVRASDHRYYITHSPSDLMYRLVGWVV